MEHFSCALSLQLIHNLDTPGCSQPIYCLCNFRHLFKFYWNIGDWTKELAHNKQAHDPLKFIPTVLIQFSLSHLGWSSIYHVVHTSPEFKMLCFCLPSTGIIDVCYCICCWGSNIKCFLQANTIGLWFLPAGVAWESCETLLEKVDHLRQALRFYSLATLLD